MFVFLLLGARYIVYQVPNRFLTPVDLKKILRTNVLKRKEAESWVECKVEAIQPGDIVMLESGDTLPVDGRLIEGEAEFNQSLFSGESFPVLLPEWGTVPAGSQLVSQRAVLEVVNSARDSKMTQLLNQINQAVFEKTPSSLLADRGAHYLSLFIVFVGVSFSIFGFAFGVEGWIERVLAFLVIACPCALAIATPLGP